MIEKIRVDLGERSYPIVVGSGAWGRIKEHLEGRTPSGTALVTDDRVGSLYGDTLLQVLSGADPNPLVITVPQGENSKSFDQLEYICRKMAKAGIEREGLVLALGGGVVGDLAGLAASTYLRGIRLIQVPTTLLSMVDSSVGGKTGINIPEGKNLVGTFFQPEAVFADVESLRTLDDRDWYSGLAEAVKIAITLDTDLFEYLESARDLGPGGGIDISRVILAACLRKADVVRRDEKEEGIRRVLNFGHTIAHGFEAALGYGEIRHGEAVALGMKAALRLSQDACGLSREHFERAMALLERIPVPEVNMHPKEIEPFLKRDKKSVGGTVQAVLVSAIGKSEFLPLMEPDLLLSALAEPGKREGRENDSVTD
jgi:3-dehydroquinate synthase